MALTYFALGDQDPSEGIKANWGPMTRLTQPTLQVKHGYAGAEKLGEMMQQQQPVPQGHDGDLLQMVVLHGNLSGKQRRDWFLQKMFLKNECRLPETAVEGLFWRQHLRWHLPSISGLAGGPGEGVSRATGHPVDLLPL